MGLHYNTTLQELGLSRNSVLAGGAKRIARALEGSPSLACLDLSGQRFEGLGHRGAEAIATLIRWEGETALISARVERCSNREPNPCRRNTSITEINVSGNSIGAAGAAALASSLRAASAGSRLARLVVGSNGFDSGSTAALFAAGAERGVVVNV